MKRLPNWQGRLAEALKRAGAVPYAWGANDCALGLAAAAVEAVTGADLGAQFRGLYDTEEGALKVLRDQGAKSLHELVGRYLPPIPLGDMRIGDLAAVPHDSAFGSLMAVCNGERLIVLGPDGRGTLPRAAAAMAFRVGD